MVVRRAGATTTRGRSCASCPARSPSSENIVCVICQTSAVIFSKNASSSGSRDAMSSSGSPSASLEPRRPRRRRAPRVMPSSSPLERPSVNANTRRPVDADDLRLALLDHLLERPATARRPRARPGGRAAGRRPPASSTCAPRRRRPATCRRARCARRTASPTGAVRGGALVEEHVDRPPARGERLGRDDRREHRVLVVLAHRHDPHVDAVLAHERAAGTCRAASSATPAASPPARAACRTAARLTATPMQPASDPARPARGSGRRDDEGDAEEDSEELTHAVNSYMNATPSGQPALRSDAEFHVLRRACGSSTKCPRSNLRARLFLYSPNTSVTSSRFDMGSPPCRQHPFEECP